MIEVRGNTPVDDPWGDIADPFKEDSLEDVLARVDRETKEESEPEAEAEQTEKPKEAEEKPKYTKAELLAVYDTLVFEGTYTEVYRSRGINVEYRTRSGDDVVRLNQYLDAYQAKSMASLQTYSNMLTLAASLKSFNGKEFKPGDIRGTFEYLKTQPDAVNTVLLMNLSEFDMKIGMAIEEGRKNF